MGPIKFTRGVNNSVVNMIYKEFGQPVTSWRPNIIWRILFYGPSTEQMNLHHVVTNWNQVDWIMCINGFPNIVLNTYIVNCLFEGGLILFQSMDRFFSVQLEFLNNNFIVGVALILLHGANYETLPCKEKLVTENTLWFDWLE